MLKYVTKNEYQELLGATSIPDNFNQLVVKASSYINKMTFGRIDINNIPEEVKFATSLIIQLLIEKENALSEMKNLKSQNIEGWSETYQTPEEIKFDYDNKMYSVLETYLWNLHGKDCRPLLYKGVDVIG